MRALRRGKVLFERRRHVARHPIDTDARREPDQRAGERRVLGDVNLLAVGKPAFQLLSQDGGGREATDQL